MNKIRVIILTLCIVALSVLPCFADDTLLYDDYLALEYYGGDWGDGADLEIYARFRSNAVTDNINNCRFTVNVSYNGSVLGTYTYLIERTGSNDFLVASIAVPSADATMSLVSLEYNYVEPIPDDPYEPSFPSFTYDLLFSKCSECLDWLGDFLNIGLNYSIVLLPICLAFLGFVVRFFFKLLFTRI